MSESEQTGIEGRELFTVDIGSTVIKFARLDENGELVRQEFHDRDFEREIVDQIDAILQPFAPQLNRRNLVICSSANGGLRVGIVCLSESYSGATIRNQVLLGGANPVYVQEIRHTEPNPAFVDVLLVGGGIDCPDVGPMRTLIDRFDPSHYRYGTLAFVGNRFLAEEFRKRFPEAKVIANPMHSGLAGADDSVFEALRDAYLDDLVYKQGISEIGQRVDAVICPTPEVVNRGYYKAITEHRMPGMTGASILVDIGGATTDFHYTVEVVRDDSPNRPPSATSVGRYVFADLGIFASRDSTTLQLRRNPRTFEFLDCVVDDDVSEIYRQLREGEYVPSPEMLAYACLFIGLDRFSQGKGPGLPTAELGKLDRLVLTGGAAQLIDADRATDVASLFLPAPPGPGFVMIDSRYEIWIRGALAHRLEGDRDERRPTLSAGG